MTNIKNSVTASIAVIGCGPAGLAVSIFWSLKTKDLKTTKAQGINAWKDRICDYWPQAEAMVG